MCGVNEQIKRVVIETTGVCANNVARGIMTLCCDIMSHYVMSRHYVFCDTHVHRSFFQNALVDHIGVCTDTNKMTFKTQIIFLIIPKNS